MTSPPTGTITFLFTDIEGSTRLWGSADALRESIGGPLPPIGQAQLDELLAKARASLGDAPFEAAWAEGRALSWEQAVEFALREA